MTTIDRSALLPHSAEQLFDLVADIERYPEFLSGCVEARILERAPDLVTARLGLARAGFSHTLITRNAMTPHESIELQLVDGPFERFDGAWHFRALTPDACKVSLSLRFSMRSGLMHAATGHLFDRIALDLVDSVARRAAIIYGKETA